MQSGRETLIKKDLKKAVESFAEAMQKKPNYPVRSMHFSEGYGLISGRLREVRQSLERALAVEKEDRLAKRYLGLALLGAAINCAACPNCELVYEVCMTGLSTSSAAGRSNLTGTPIGESARRSKNLGDDWRSQCRPLRLCAAAHWVGQEFEEEIERARRDGRCQNE